MLTVIQFIIDGFQPKETEHLPNAQTIQYEIASGRTTVALYVPSLKVYSRDLSKC